MPTSTADRERFAELALRGSFLRERSEELILNSLRLRARCVELHAQREMELLEWDDSSTLPDAPVGPPMTSSPPES